MHIPVDIRPCANWNAESAHLCVHVDLFEGLCLNVCVRALASGSYACLSVCVYVSMCVCVCVCVCLSYWVQSEVLVSGRAKQEEEED